MYVLNNSADSQAGFSGALSFARGNKPTPRKLQTALKVRAIDSGP